MNQTIGNYLIRSFDQSDAPAIAKHANNRKIWLNLRDGFPHPYALCHAEGFLSGVIKTEPQTVFAIATPAEAIGCIGLTIGQDVHHLTAELGYWLAEPFWGQGIMPLAIGVVVKYAFGTLGLNRVHADPYTTNPASARVLEKAGFEREGILRASVIKDGKILDQALYAKIRDRITQPPTAGYGSQARRT